jgi:hypothetical protein
VLIQLQDGSNVAAPVHRQGGREGGREGGGEGGGGV